jgi:hypothetical protein
LEGELTGSFLSPITPRKEKHSREGLVRNSEGKGKERRALFSSQSR